MSSLMTTTRASDSVHSGSGGKAGGLKLKAWAKLDGDQDGDQKPGEAGEEKGISRRPGWTGRSGFCYRNRQDACTASALSGLQALTFCAKIIRCWPINSAVLFNKYLARCQVFCPEDTNMNELPSCWLYEA